MLMEKCLRLRECSATLSSGIDGELFSLSAKNLCPMARALGMRGVHFREVARQLAGSRIEWSSMEAQL